MKSKLLALVAVGLLAGPMAAQATLVQWQVGGVLTAVTGTAEEIAGVTEGQDFGVILTFDTAAPVTNPMACGGGGIGTTCFHGLAGAQISFTNLQLGSLFAPAFGTMPGRNVIIVRNDAPAPGAGVISDGYSFGGSDYDSTSGELQSIALILRGPENLGVVTDGRVLPALPPPGMLDWGIREFSICVGISSNGGQSSDCSFANILGRIDRISAVPEPGTLALIGLGLAGLGLSRRRKAN